MGGRSSSVHHHHHAPPGPSLQERLNNAKSKIEVEEHAHERLLAQCKERNQLFSLEMRQSTQEMMQTLSQLNSERANADAQRAQELRAITDQLQAQLNNCDVKLQNLHKEHLDCQTEIRKFEDLSKLARSKCDNYLANKKEEESMLKKELDKVIQQHFELVNSTEKTQEAWINSPALTNESKRRCAALSAELLWLPQKEVNDSNLFGMLAGNLIAFLDELVPFVTLLNTKLQHPTMHASHNETKALLQEKLPNPKIMDLVDKEGLTLGDLSDLVKEPDALPEMQQISQFHRNRLEKCLTEIQLKENNSHQEFKQLLSDFMSKINRVLLWRDCCYSSSEQIIKAKFLSAESNLREISAN